MKYPFIKGDYISNCLYRIYSFRYLSVVSFLKFKSLIKTSTKNIRFVNSF